MDIWREGSADRSDLIAREKMCSSHVWEMCAMGRRSKRLLSQQTQPFSLENKEVIQVVSRAFDILRCFQGPSMRLGNREISDRCGLPRSTVSRLTWTLTQIGQLRYLPQEQKYAIGQNAFAFGTSLLVESWDRIAFVGMRDQGRTNPMPTGQPFPERGTAMGGNSDVRAGA